MSRDPSDTICIIPEITGAYGETANPKLEVVDKVFIPLISLDTAHNTETCTYLGNLDEEVLELINFDKPEIPVETVKFTVKTTVRLKIEQGNNKAELEEESLMGISNQVKMTKVIHNGQTYDCTQLDGNSSEFTLDKVKYGDTFEIEIEPYELFEDSYNDAYILFRYYGYVSLDDCGKVRFTNTSKVGKRLVTNIRNSPKTQTPLDPKASFAQSIKQANLSQNPGGLCYAITMAWVNKAYVDLFKQDVLTLNTTNSDDARYSGTTIPSIPDNLFGYGVGAALMRKNHVKLLTIEDAINGKLEEGAVIQYWANNNNVSWTKLKTALRDFTMQGRTNNNRDYSYGHSVIFKTYLYSDKGDIIGLKYCDQWLFDRKAPLENGIFHVYNGNKKLKAYILGANLIDIK